MTKQLIFSLAILLCGIHNTAHAQTEKITGLVADSSGNPLSLVTVRLTKTGEPALVLQTTLTKDNGTYLLNKTAPGNYTLLFSHSGFIASQQSITVATGNETKAETVTLAKANNTLNEVVIKTQRPLVEQGDDKVVYNAEEDPASKSETAIEILRKTPFVSVDGEDNIKVNGKSNFKVLLNNRETSCLLIM